ncbi:MAG: hypothetical protein ACK45Y_14790, partial [Betaproteobacteria bacterium]
MKLYVITGTTKGIGQALATELGRDEHNMVIEISRGVSGENGRNALLHADFADLKTIASAMAALTGLVGEKRFTDAVLINNAGVVLPV